MEKDFDAWNVQKKRLHRINKRAPYYREGEIWWLTLGVNVGYEQDGTGKRFDRPVLVLRAFSRHGCLVLPLTTSEKRDSYYLDVGIVDGVRAAIIISQIRFIDTCRLSSKMCSISPHLLEHIKKTVRSMI